MRHIFKNVKNPKRGKGKTSQFKIDFGSQII